MLLPRPEIRTPTRRGSCIVRRGPVLGRVPRAVLAFHRAAAAAGFDSSDLEDALAGAFEVPRDFIQLVRAIDHGHADAAVERARHLFRSDASCILKQREDRRQSPPISVYDRVAAIRQNPRNILEKSAAGDVGQTLDAPLLDEWE